MLMNRNAYWGLLLSVSIVVTCSASVLSTDVTEMIVAEQTSQTGNTPVFGEYGGEAFQIKGNTFTPSDSGEMSRIGISMFREGAPDDNWLVRVSIYTTADTKLPDQLLASQTLAVSAIGGTYTYFDFNSLGVSLTAGQRYAFVVELPDAVDADDCIRIREMGSCSNDEFSLSANDGGSGYYKTKNWYEPKFKVYANVVPEPASLGLLALGGLLGLRRR